MASDILFYVIYFALTIPPIICGFLIVRFLARYHRGFDYLLKANRAEGLEREALITKAIGIVEIQLSRIKEGRRKAARAELKHTLGLAYAMLAETKNESSNMDLAIKAYRESIELTDRDKQRAHYVLRKKGLGETHLERAEMGDLEKNVELALAEFEGALTAATTEETAAERPKLLTETAKCHMVLATSRKDKREAMEAIRLVKDYLSGIDPQKNPIEYHGGNSILALAYFGLAQYADKKDNLKSALECCTLTLRSQPLIKKEIISVFSGVNGNADMLKQKEEALHNHASGEFENLGAISTIHMQLADIEDRQKHLSEAKRPIDDAAKVEWNRLHPEASDTIKRWIATLERMNRGETYAQAFGKEIGAVDPSASMTPERMDL